MCRGGDIATPYKYLSRNVPKRRYEICGLYTGWRTPHGSCVGRLASIGLYGDCATIPKVVRWPRASSSSSYTLHLLYCVYVVLYCLIDLSSMYLSYLSLLVFDDLVSICSLLLYFICDIIYTCVLYLDVFLQYMWYILELLVQAVWATIVGHFLIAGDVPLVYILYALFTTLLGRPMIPTEYKWTVLMPTAPFWCRS